MNNNLMITGISLDRDKIPNYLEYPFNIELVKNFDEVKFNSPVTFFVGENGVGKSTFIEAIAVAYGLNPEGGSQNYIFETKNTHSNLHEYLNVHRLNKPRMKYFLRAESFYNVATKIDEVFHGEEGARDKVYGGSLHGCSHGEAFISLVKNSFIGNGLYILDEPEAALSPSRQMTLLCLIDDLVKKGAQFIIATHSPILISYINGTIYDLNNNFEIIKYEDTEIYKTYKMYIDNPYGIQHHLFSEEE